MLSLTELKEFNTQMKNLFYVSIEFSHSYEYSLQATNSTKFIAETVLQEMTKKFETLEKVFNFLSWTCSFFFIFIIFR